MVELGLRHFVGNRVDSNWCMMMGRMIGVGVGVGVMGRKVGVEIVVAVVVGIVGIVGRVAENLLVMCNPWVFFELL